jgi:hypothetical protein
MGKKRTAYFSWGASEHAKLLEATHDEVVMYLTVLKPLGDFRSGVVGTVTKRPLTFASLGERMGRPVSQGRPAVSYDSTEAKRILERLAARGLVADMAQVGGALVMVLPLSPIGASEEAGKLSDKACGEKSDKPHAARVSEHPQAPPSVLTSIGQSRQGKTNTGQPPACETFEAASIGGVESDWEAALGAAIANDEGLPEDDTEPSAPPCSRLLAL